MDEALLLITAITSAVTALTTIALVWVAWVTLGGARDQLKLLRDDSDRQTRPYVFVDVVPGLHGPGYWDVVIANYGQSTAHDVRIDAGQLTPTGSGDHITEKLLRFLAVPMALPPSAKRRVMWRSEETDSGSEDAGAPSRSEVSVTYTDEDGRAYTDAYVLSVDLYGAVAPAPTTGPKALGSNKQLDNIERDCLDFCVSGHG